MQIISLPFGRLNLLSRWLMQGSGTEQHAAHGTWEVECLVIRVKLSLTLVTTS